MAVDLPLNALLGRCVLSLTREYERRGDDLPPLPMLLIALRVVDDDGVDSREAPALARASRRAMSVLLKTDSFERRGQRVYLTPSGRTARRDGFAALGAAEASWTARVGRTRVATLRKAVVLLVDRFELELPHYWISYGGVDPRVTGGNFRPAKTGPPRIPARGQDWTPVLREEASSSADLCLTALLAQALVGFAIEYEARAGPLSDAIHTLAPLNTTGVPLDQAPTRAELSGDGKSRLERHGVVVVETDAERGRVARLTSIGEWLRDAYAPTTSQVEAVWREAYGDAVITRLRSALESVAPNLEAGVADHPFLAWSRREGIRETTN